MLLNDTELYFFWDYHTLADESRDCLDLETRGSKPYSLVCQLGEFPPEGVLSICLVCS